MNPPSNPSSSSVSAENQAGGNDATGFELIEQLLREKAAGQGALAESLIQAPLTRLAAAAEAASNPKSGHRCQTVAAGFEKTQELLEILSGGNSA